MRGLAAGLGADAEAVTSPTFVLIQHYKGPRFRSLHADLYGLENKPPSYDLGLEELGNGAVVAVEWAERMKYTPEDSITVPIEDLGGDSRRITSSQP